MRELLFRAWDKKLKQWVVQGFHIFGEVTLFNMIGNYCYENAGEDGSLMRYNDIEVTQFTGLKDKNGKDIYEGDILDGHSDGYGKVVYEDSVAGFGYVFKDGESVGLFELHMPNVSIIGNAYENPDLIK